ncbi:hypothetical protein [Hymenobacter sp. BRD67]|uniref:hypothetical protein n=1 Tax=Hymenobacter sp. BRD67 TaxID=2675877 RepID=UPI00293BB8D0|nr:hypothetical protein [Hymenobacter sp. BRD67]
MPAKSTFFYPKTLAGLLFTDLHERVESVFEAYFQVGADERLAAPAASGRQSAG